MFPKSRTSVVAVGFATLVVMALVVMALVVMALVVMALAVWLASDPFEPRFNGRRDREVVISTWNSWITNRQVDYAPLDALGSQRSVSAIIKLYRSYQPSWRARRAELLYQCWALGPIGTWPTIDNWIMQSQTLAYTELSVEAVQQLSVRALEHFGPAASPAVPLLVQRLATNDSIATVKALGAIGPAAATGLPHLRRLASTNDLWFLHSVGESLRRIEPGSELIILPTSLANLSSTNERVRAKAAQLLSLIGPPASNAIPRLRELRGDSWKMVRDAADQALASISPSSAPARP